MSGAQTAQTGAPTHAKWLFSAAMLLAFGFSGWMLKRLTRNGGDMRHALSLPAASSAIGAQRAAAAAADKGGKGGNDKGVNGPLPKAGQELVLLYGRMEREFATGNLNTQGIQAMQPWFHGMDRPDDTPWPKKYADFPEPLPPFAVRLIVIPLEYAPDLQSIGSAVTRSILALLPPGTKAFANSRTHYHMTMFHTSHPGDPRPDARARQGGLVTLAEGEPLAAPAARRGPSGAELEGEEREARGLAASVAPPVLRLERVLFASSGTLLLTWVDTTDHVQELRAKCKDAFPGAPPKQASIIHTTLLRVISAEALPEASARAIVHKCVEWTAQLRGRTYTPRGLWLVREAEYSTILGDKASLPLKLET